MNSYGSTVFKVEFVFDSEFRIVRSRCYPLFDFLSSWDMLLVLEVWFLLNLFFALIFITGFNCFIVILSTAI